MFGFLLTDSNGTRQMMSRGCQTEEHRALRAASKLLRGERVLEATANLAPPLFSSFLLFPFRSLGLVSCWFVAVSSWCVAVSCWFVAAVSYERSIGHAREKEKDFLVNGQLSNWIDRSRVDRGQQPHKTTLEKLIHPKEA